MYGRIKEKPLTKTSQPLTCESIRQQLQQYIDTESRRVNVDSAKKRAVLQHMDYEGFRQMVLGANLFCVKSAELNKFSGGLLDGPTEKTFNVLAVGKKQKQIKPNFQIVELSQKDSKYMPMLCNLFNEFKKRFQEFFKLPLQQGNVTKLYQLLKDQDEGRLLKIFNSDFDPSYLGKICQVFIFVMNNHVLKQKDINEFLFICKFLQTIGNIKTIGPLVLKLLSKKQKAALKQLLCLIQESSIKQKQIISVKQMYQKYVN